MSCDECHPSALATHSLFNQIEERKARRKEHWIELKLPLSLSFPLGLGDGGMEVMRRKRGEKKKDCKLLIPLVATNISSHRMYEIIF
jgi:hypothetical protein